MASREPTQVDATRIRELTDESLARFYVWRQMVDCVISAVEEALIEQRRWLMQLVCSECGGVHTFPRTDNELGYICTGAPITRAQYLYERG